MMPCTRDTGGRARATPGRSLATVAVLIVVAMPLGAQTPRPRPRPQPAPVVRQPPAPARDTARIGLDPSTAIAAPVAHVCPAAVSAWWREHGRGGRIACASDPTKPAILLVHGLHQDMRTWTEPSHSDFAYEYGDDPSGKRIGEIHQEPNVGIYKIGRSDWLYGDDRAAWDKEVNWFDFLRKEGYTVATWGQPGLRFNDAVPSALEAFDSLLAHTAARSPAAPPPVALVGHSRGGLLIRKLLKERGSMDRVQWVVTLHSPHKGSGLASTPGRIIAEAVDLMDAAAPASLTGPLKTELKNLVIEAMRPFTKIIWLAQGEDGESHELIPDGPLVRGLANGEAAIPGVKYHTFGGTNPRYFRLYTWIFDDESAKPQYRCTNELDPTTCRQYFVWRVRPHEIAPVSPMLDDMRDFAAELKPGEGDGLVTNASSRLPWSTHVTTDLNHAEVLWDRPLQQQVAKLFQTVSPRAPGRLVRRSPP